MIEATIYKALGDPVRLEIVMRLANGTPRTIGEVTKGLGVSRQGARKQLQVLATANIVRFSPQGRETKVVLAIESLRIAQQFIGKLESQWGQRLNALKDFVENDDQL